MTTLTTLIVYILSGIASFIFLGGWLVFDRGFSWTFGVALLCYVPMIYFMFVKEWLAFGVMAFMFIAFAHLYAFDKYFSVFHASKGGRR